MDGKIITNPDPKWFTTDLTGREGAHVYPFFGTEDGDLFGLGHQDPEVFAAEVLRYWAETDSGDPDLTKVADIIGEVEHGWYRIIAADPELTDYEFWIERYVRLEDGDPDPAFRVTAETPGAVAITTVRF